MTAVSLSRFRRFALTLVGRTLVAVDSVRRRLSWRRDPGREAVATSAAGPNGVLVAVSHWRDEDEAPDATVPTPDHAGTDRSRMMTECVASVLELGADRVVVAVFTNEPSQTARALTSRFGHAPDLVSVEILRGIASLEATDTGGRQIFVIGWKPRVVFRHGFNLTWAHKRLFRRALDDHRFSHFVYLEDDIRFTRESFSYWCRFREPLAAYGLLPGYVRYESTDAGRFLADQSGRQRLDGPSVRVHAPRADGATASDALVVAFDNAYQGMYVLDRPLARKHFRYSPNRTLLRSLSVRHWAPSESVGHWGWRERAAAGPIFDDVPSGFTARNVVPVRNDETGGSVIDPACLIEHLSGTITASADSPFGRVSVDDPFRP